MTGRRKPREKRLKSLWAGVFNGQRYIHQLHCYAYSKAQARVLFCRMIAKRLGVPVWSTLQYFNGDKNNFSITLEGEFREDERGN
jgi:hypothetical protein